MPLALGFRHGNDFFVGDKRFVVFDVESPVRFKISDEEGGVFQITEFQWVLLMPDVWVQAGVQHTLDDLGLARLVFEAPRSVKIYRGDIYRARGKS